MAEKESYAKFTSIIDQIFDNVEDMDIVGGAEGYFHHFAQLCLIFGSSFYVNVGMLLTILEKNIRDVIAVEGSQPLIPFFDDRRCSGFDWFVGITGIASALMPGTISKSCVRYLLLLGS
uniref:Uncharacterized protein n=1 Tax=Parascaris equorum TaxID=6256 RepID=A0A914R4F6_PAREQ